MRLDHWKMVARTRASVARRADDLVRQVREEMNQFPVLPAGAGAGTGPGGGDAAGEALEAGPVARTTKYCARCSGILGGYGAD